MNLTHDEQQTSVPTGVRPDVFTSPTAVEGDDSAKMLRAAKEAGRGAIAMTQSATLVVDGVEVEIGTDRMWDEATYQAAGTPIDLFRDVYENRPDQHDELEETYGTEVVERAIGLKN